MTEPIETQNSTSPCLDSAPAVVASVKTEKPTKPKIDVQPVLQKLFELYPHLFGSQFLPLKLGTYQDLMAAHPDAFKKDSLKVALGFHTRSTRYLQCVADGKLRHDLQGNAVEPVAPEHVYLALLELFRRRSISNAKSRTPLDLRPIFRKQLIAAYLASGLSRQDYQVQVQNADEEATKLLTEALDQHEAKLAKQVALQQAYKTSTEKNVTTFAAMYGLDEQAVQSLLKQS